MHYVNTSILQGRQTTYDTFSTPIFKGHSFYQISNQFLFDFKNLQKQNITVLLKTLNTFDCPRTSDYSQMDGIALNGPIIMKDCLKP